MPDSRTKRKYSRRRRSKKATLPPIGTDIRLSDYGYALRKSPRQRQASLRKASKKNGTLSTLLRVNLIRNYTAVPDNKKKLTADVEYMKKLYAKEKSKKSKKASKKKSSKKKKSSSTARKVKR